MSSCFGFLGEEERRSVEEALRLTSEALSLVEARKNEVHTSARGGGRPTVSCRTLASYPTAWFQGKERMQRYCTKCGWKLLSREDHYCGGCGLPLPRFLFDGKRITPRSTLQYEEGVYEGIPCDKEGIQREYGNGTYPKPSWESSKPLWEAHAKDVHENQSKDVHNDRNAKEWEVASVPSWETTGTESSEEQNVRRERMPFRMPGSAFDGEPSSHHEETRGNARHGGKVTFLGLGRDMPLMVQEELDHSLEKVFKMVFADDSGFLQTMHGSTKGQGGVKLKVTPWVSSPDLDGHVRTVILQTVHPKLGELESIDLQFYRWCEERMTLLYENKCTTPRFPYGNKWRIERRCAFVSTDGNTSLVTVSAGMFILEEFAEEQKLRRAVDPTILPDCQTFIQAIKAACSTEG